MQTGNSDGLKLGINGFGRIGKLTLWHHVARKYFSEIIVNIGRNVGTSLEDIAHYAERDSTYGSLHGFLYGQASEPLIKDLDEQNGTMNIDGVTVCFLRTSRNPAELNWKKQGVKLVVDTTGNFLDPTLSPDHPKGLCGAILRPAPKKLSFPRRLKSRIKGCRCRRMLSPR